MDIKTEFQIRSFNLSILFSYALVSKMAIEVFHNNLFFIPSWTLHFSLFGWFYNFSLSLKSLNFNIYKSRHVSLIPLSLVKSCLLFLIKATSILILPKHFFFCTLISVQCILGEVLDQLIQILTWFLTVSILLLTQLNFLYKIIFYNQYFQLVLPCCHPAEILLLRTLIYSS